MAILFPELIVEGPFPKAEHLKTQPRAWTRFSLPLPQGVLRPDAPLMLEAPDGARLPLQTRSLARWKDGSVKWLDAETLVSAPGTYRIGEGAADPVSGWPRAVFVTTDADGSVRLDNGLVAVTVSPDGASPIRSIRHQDNLVSDSDLALEAIVLDRDGTFFSTRHESARSVTVRHDGPIRAVVDVRGRHVESSGRSCLSYRLRLEICAGAPALTLRYWVFHEDPGSSEHRLQRISLKTAWKQANPTRRFLHQTRYGMLSVPREAETDRPVDIRSGPVTPWIHVEDPACWKDEHDYPDFMCDPRDTKPYIGLALDAASVLLRVEDFAELLPKGLSSDGNEITLHVWPEWAGELSMRQGWSREMVVRAVFPHAGAPVTEAILNALCAAMDGSATSAVSPDWHVEQKAWLMDTVLLKTRGSKPGTGAGDQVKANRFLSGLCELPTVMGMWDLGDTIDPGYTTTYSYSNRLPRKQGSPPQQFTKGGAFTRRYLEDNMLHNEPVWANNEYDVIMCLARECMRGGHTPELRQKLRWFARHAIEVDFVHYSDHPELHHGSPAHSLRHCMATAYPSHLWCEGLLMYYCLTGDDDALDVSVKMGDFIVDTFRDPARRGKLWKFTRELGWALLYLACVADMTGEKRFFDMADEIAALFMVQPLSDALLDNMLAYSFGYSSLALGMEMYQRATGRKDLADWLTRLADSLLRRIDSGASCGGMGFNYFIAAWTVSGNRRYLDLLPLEDDGSGMFTMDGRWLDGRWLHTKQVAMAYRPASRLAYLLSQRGARDNGHGAK